MGLKAVPPPSGGHLLGQPFTISEFSLPVNARLHCNCGVHTGEPAVDVPIINSAPAQCSRCQKTYIATYNPANGQIQVAIGVPDTKVPS